MRKGILQPEQVRLYAEPVAVDFATTKCIKTRFRLLRKPRFGSN